MKRTKGAKRVKLNQSFIDNVSAERYTYKSRLSKSKQTSLSRVHPDQSPAMCCGEESLALSRGTADTADVAASPQCKLIFWWFIGW
jgi:hypothetical protein